MLVPHISIVIYTMDVSYFSSTQAHSIHPQLGFSSLSNSFPRHTCSSHRPLLLLLHLLDVLLTTLLFAVPPGRQCESVHPSLRPQTSATDVAFLLRSLPSYEFRRGWTTLKRRLLYKGDLAGDARDDSITYDTSSVSTFTTESRRSVVSMCDLRINLHCRITQICVTLVIVKLKWGMEYKGDHETKIAWRRRLLAKTSTATALPLSQQPA